MIGKEKEDIQKRLGLNSKLSPPLQQHDGSFFNHGEEARTDVAGSSSMPFPDSNLQTSSVIPLVNLPYSPFTFNALNNAPCNVNNFLLPDATPEGTYSPQDVHELKKQLNIWAVKCRVGQNTYSELLAILKSTLKINIPKDARTTLKSSPIESGKIVDMSPGCYYHFGVEKSILYILKKFDSYVVPDVLSLVINIDGLPLAKSSTSEFWPILGKIENFQKEYVFPIGVYHGFSKPLDANDFLHFFAEEFETLKESGIFFEGKSLKVAISKILCDAPAKSFILCVKGHNGHFSCTKCTAEGSFINRRMAFPVLDSPLRTDQSFLDMLDEEYHKCEASSMLKLNVGMVSQVPLDYMHLVCLGVMKRLILFWMKGNYLVRFTDEQKSEVDKDIEKFRKSSLLEFARKPRSLKEVDRWKASEFRQFLLYYGPAVLKHTLNPTLYNHFLCLHCGIRIMTSPELCVQSKYLDFADVLLRHFVENFGEMYGEEFVNHNVHNLIHLKNDVLKFGHLDQFSCFSFENYMHVIKMSLKSTKFPLKSFIKQVQNHQAFSNNNGESQNSMELLKPLGVKNINGDLVQIYGAINIHNVVFRLSEPNCYFILKEENKVAKLIEVFVKETIPYIIYKKFACFEPFFKEPFSSTLFYCGLVDDLQTDTSLTTVDNIRCKCLVNENICLSLIHN